MNKLTFREFYTETINKFPHLIDELREDEGLPYLQLGTFARYTQSQIDSSDTIELSRCLNHINQFNENGDEGLRNAIGVSYLEHLNFRDGKVKRKWALKYLPPQLKKEYKVLNKKDL